MKKISFLLLVMIISIGLTIESYSAKDTLPPNPVFTFCPNCGGTHCQAYADEMPRNGSASGFDSVILHKESYNYFFSYEDFISGRDIWLKWRAYVFDVRKEAFIKITFKDVAGNDTTIQNYFSPKKIRATPSIDFGIFNVGDSKEMECRIISESTIPDTIIKLKFKNYYHDFEITNIHLPIIMRYGDTLNFKVRFTALQNGEFNDSIGIETFCYNVFLSRVYAIVGSPKTNVSNNDFGDVPLFKTAHSNLKIDNLGIIPLVITGYKGPNYPSTFIPDLPDISASNPLVIEPNQSFLFNVSFWPTEELTYKDSIIFINNIGVVNTSDSVAELSGRGIIVESVDNLIGDKEIKFYPNPADDFLLIKFNDEFIKSDFIKLFDSFGNVIYENKNIDTQNLKIRTSEIASGMYFLQIGNGGVRKVLVVH